MGPDMNKSSYRRTFAAILAFAMLVLAQPSHAQENAAPGVSVVAQSASAQATTDATARSADGGGPPLKSAAPTLHELSPWSMFLSADILVKASCVYQKPYPS